MSSGFLGIQNLELILAALGYQPAPTEDFAADCCCARALLPLLLPLRQSAAAAALWRSGGCRARALLRLLLPPRQSAAPAQVAAAQVALVLRDPLAFPFASSTARRPRE
jgi:hypothetical protein